MEKHEVLVDDSACVGCGKCVSDCVAGTIRLIDGKGRRV